MNDFAGKALEGDWWFPSAPEVQYFGTLTLDEKNHGRLVLKGKQSELIKLWPPKEKQFTIHGLLKNRYTYEVSLFDSGLLQAPTQTISQQVDPITTAEYFTNHVLIGEHVEDENHPFISLVNIYLTGLEQWCDGSGITGKIKYKNPPDFGNTQATLKYTPRKTPHYKLGDNRLICFLSHYTGPTFFPDGLKKVEIEERSAIQLAFSNPISIKAMLEEIHIWQTFIALGLRKPCHIDKINPLFSRGDGQFYSLELIVPGAVAEERRRFSDPRTKLFTQSKLGRNLGKYLKGWRKVHETLAVPILLYSGTTFQEKAYSHANLLTYLQALEVLHRERFKYDKFPTAALRKNAMKALKDAVPPSLGPELKDAITKQLSFIGGLTLLDRLTHLYELHSGPVSAIFPNKQQDMNKLKEVRNFLTHFGGNKSFKKDSLWSYEIYALKEKSRLFLEICLLAAMGMTDENILKLLNQFEDFTEWRTQSRTPPPS